MAFVSSICSTDHRLHINCLIYYSLLTPFQDVGQREYIYNDEWAALASMTLKRVNEVELNVLDAIVCFQ